MRPHDGVVSLTWEEIPILKHHALLFDTFYTPYLEKMQRDGVTPGLEYLTADLEFLQDRKIIINVPERVSTKNDEASAQDKAYLDAAMVMATRHVGRTIIEQLNDHIASTATSISLLKDYHIRRVSAQLNATSALQAVPICKVALPSTLSIATDIPKAQQDVLRVAIESLPVPGDECSWQDIIDFKADRHDKQWDFRRFLRTLATKQQTEAEIKDDLDWTVNEYRKAMKIHEIKSSHSFVDVFIIAPLEIIEDLVKLKWSKIAKGTLSVRHRKVELMEAEAKASGRECAYVFDAQKRFGSK